jgi:hypothetical protein
VDHAARSTSQNYRIVPLPFGHSRANVLLTKAGPHLRLGNRHPPLREAHPSTAGWRERSRAFARQFQASGKQFAETSKGLKPTRPTRPPTVTARISSQ